MIVNSKNGKYNKIHVLIDNEYVITTNLDFWLKSGYHDGDEIDQEELEELLHKINYNKAKQKCYDYINRREYSAKQLKQKLLSAGFDEITSDNVVQECQDNGIIDDSRFAKTYIEHMYLFNNYSLRRIKYELSAAGVDKDIIDYELNIADVDDKNTIKKIIEKKYLYKINLSETNSINKIISSLQRRGFLYPDIKYVLGSLEEEF